MDSGQQECRKDGLKGEAVILASPAQRPSWLLYGLLTYRVSDIPDIIPTFPISLWVRVEMSICGDYRDLGGTSPWMDKGRIMQEQLSRVKQGENHAMMAFERETWRSNRLFNKDVIARTESNYRPGLSRSGIQLLMLILQMDSGQQECRNDEIDVPVILYSTRSARRLFFSSDCVVSALTAKRHLCSTNTMSSQPSPHLSSTYSAIE